MENHLALGYSSRKPFSKMGYGAEGEKYSNKKHWRMKSIYINNLSSNTFSLAGIAGGEGGGLGQKLILRKNPIKIGRGCGVRRYFNSYSLSHEPEGRGGGCKGLKKKKGGGPAHVIAAKVVV